MATKVWTKATVLVASAFVLLIVILVMLFSPHSDNLSNLAPRVAVLKTKKQSQSTTLHNQSSSSSSLSSTSSWATVCVMPRRPVSNLRRNLEASIGTTTTTTTASKDVQKYLGEHCRPTSQVRILYNDAKKTTTITNETATDHLYHRCWILQSFDDQGKPKTQGGDEFYIAYFDDDDDEKQRRKTAVDPTAVALVHDNNDGTYDLDFITTPMHRHSITSNISSRRRREKGRLHVYFQYTCSLGRLAPPVKEHWVSGARSDLFFSAKVSAPPIRPFRPPVEYNLSQYSSVFFVGDSLFRQLARGEGDDADPSLRRYFRPHTYMADPIYAALSMGTVEGQFLDHIDSRHGKELQGMVPSTANAKNDSQNMALLIGSSVWDILTPQQHRDEFFVDHLLACRVYVSTVRERYPLVQIFWKSGTAMHVHRLPSNCTATPSCNERAKYMSHSRAFFLYTKQKELMQELDVPFVDVFEATYLSAYQSRPGDGRHYTDDFNNQLSKFLFGIDG